MYYKAILNYRRGTAAQSAGAAFSTVQSREMGFSEEEFASCLPHAVNGKLERIAGEAGAFRVGHENGVVHIRTKRKAERRLGSLSLPVLAVEIAFRGADEREYLAFMHKFDRHFLRMGG